MPKRHQDYDRIFRENLQKGLNSIITTLLGIDTARMQPIDTHLPKTLERRADAAFLIFDENGKKKEVLHLEAETKNNKQTLPKRLMLYSALYRHKEDVPVRQVVVYLGNQKMTIPDHIKDDYIDFRYTLIDIKTIPVRVFLDAETPEGNILAILGDASGRTV